MLNLVSNANKFTLSGKIEVRIDLTNIYSDRETEQAEQQNSCFPHLIVTVTDQGVGMSNEDQKELFQPFGKLEKHLNLNPRGTGLGLYNCKNLLSKLGGDIWIGASKERISINEEQGTIAVNEDHGTTIIYTMRLGKMPKEAIYKKSTPVDEPYQKHK